MTEQEIQMWKDDLDMIAMLREKNEELERKHKKILEYIEYNDEPLYTYEPDYDYEENIVDNYDPSSFKEDLLEILRGE